jgi:hypothetical protein
VEATGMSEKNVDDLLIQCLVKMSLEFFMNTYKLPIDEAGFLFMGHLERARKEIEARQ